MARKELEDFMCGAELQWDWYNCYATNPLPA
jgi:hypothetical protein